MLSNKNWKRRLKRLAFIFVGLIALLLIANSVMNWRAGARLETRIQRLQAEGSPTSISDFALLEVPDDLNVAIVLQKAYPSLKKFYKDYSAFIDTPLGKDYRTRDIPTPDQVEAIKALLLPYEETLALLQQASELPQYASLLNFSVGKDQLLEEIVNKAGSIRSVARLLELHMQVSIVRGDLNEAISLGIVLLRLSRHYEKEPTIVSHLLSVACRGIACQGLNHAVRQETLTGEMRDRLNAELRSQTGLSGFQESLRTELALNLSALAEWRQGIAGKMFGWFITNWQSNFIDDYDVILPIAVKPWHEGRGQVDLKGTDYPILFQLLLPAIQSAYDAANRDFALQRCLLVLNELERYESEHGQEAEGLSDLSIPLEESTDPFSGKPLIVKRTEKGWLVYTVYQNGADDGGNFEELLDWGLAPYRSEKMANR